MKWNAQIHASSGTYLLLLLCQQAFLSGHLEDKLTSFISNVDAKVTLQTDKRISVYVYSVSNNEELNGPHPQDMHSSCLDHQVQDNAATVHIPFFTKKKKNSSYTMLWEGPNME